MNYPCTQDLGQVVMEVHDLEGSTLAELGFYVGRVLNGVVLASQVNATRKMGDGLRARVILESGWLVENR